MRQQLTVSKIFQSNGFPLLVAALLMAVIAGLGCAPQIGDECENRQDCPDSDQNVICDTSVDGGMCTITDCRPGQCPSESICVEFSRHESYCLRNCETDEDCRTDHRCIDDDEVDARYCFVDD